MQGCGGRGEKKQGLRAKRMGGEGDCKSGLWKPGVALIAAIKYKDACLGV